MSDATRPDPSDTDLVQDDAIVGRVFWWSLAVVVVVGVVVAAVVLLRPTGDPAETVITRTEIETPGVIPAGPATRPAVTFADVTEAAGIDFVHEDGARGEKLLPETMGSGAGFFDMDGDGDQDLLLVNGQPWGHDRSEGEPLPTMRLYRNDGTGRFEDVTAGSGLDVALMGFGCAFSDVDDDGDPDVFIAALGRDRFFRNDGTGRFTDATDEAGLAGDPDGWSTGAGFFDADADGDLDLFVCRYVQWSRSLDQAVNFTLNGRDRAYGPPINFPGTNGVLYRNDGTGRFEDVSAAAGIHVEHPATGEPMGKGLAVYFDDLDRDGRQDILVANDTVRNFLFHAQPDGTFVELGAGSGVAYDGMGNATGAMGVDGGDLMGVDRTCIAIGNFSSEPTSLFVEVPGQRLQFADLGNVLGIGAPSRQRLSFGLLFVDYDLDGHLDILQANGHLEEEISEVVPSQSYRQPTQVFWNAGDAARPRFVEVPTDETGALGIPIVGRSAASADIDGDGDLDVVLTQAGGPAVLVRNDQALGHHWLRIRVAGPPGNRDGIGTRIEIEAGGRVQRRTVGPTRSYLAQVELPVTFGLGTTDRVDVVRVRWPDGTVTEQPAPAIDTELVIAYDAPRDGG